MLFDTDQSGSIEYKEVSPNPGKSNGMIGAFFSLDSSFLGCLHNERGGCFAPVTE